MAPGSRTAPRRNRRVVLERCAAFEQVAVASGEPPIATRPSRGLRHDAERDAALRPRARPGADLLVELEVSIDLVQQQVRAGFLGDGHEAIEGGTVREHPGRVVRRVHDDEPGRGRDLPAQGVKVERPPGLFAQLVEVTSAPVARATSYRLW